MKTIFIDGQEGTTGLMIFDRLKSRDDIELIEIPQKKRKDIETKKSYLNEADLIILCLPDEAAKESVRLINNPDTKVIDASTAHRIDDNWVYGLPERDSAQREKIRTSLRVSNPGCYPTGFILALYPLIAQEIIPTDYPVTIHAVSGYSGGGKKLIDRYENPDITETSLLSCRPYALDLKQKHVPEMQKWTGLKYAPVFAPSVGNFFKGMLVSVPLIPRLLNKKLSREDMQNMLSDYYASESFVEVMPLETDSYLESGFLSPQDCNDSNRVELFVLGNNEQILLVARLDNLGKGSSGAAVQNMDIMLGL